MARRRKRRPEAEDEEGVPRWEDTSVRPTRTRNKAGTIASTRMQKGRGYKVHTPRCPSPTIPITYKPPKFTGARKRSHPTSLRAMTRVPSSIFWQPTETSQGPPAQTPPVGEGEDPADTAAKVKAAVGITCVCLLLLLFVAHAWCVWPFSQRVRKPRTVSVDPVLMAYNPYELEQRQSVAGKAICGIVAAAIVATVTLLYRSRSERVATAMSTESFFTWCFVVVVALMMVAWSYVVTWHALMAAKTRDQLKWSPSLDFFIYVGGFVGFLVLALEGYKLIFGKGEEGSNEGEGTPTDAKNKDEKATHKS